MVGTKVTKVILYFTPRCIHCVKFKENVLPELKKTLNKNNIAFEEYDVSDSKYIDKQSKVIGIGVPTLEIIIDGDPDMYMGDMTHDAIIKKLNIKTSMRGGGDKNYKHKYKKYKKKYKNLQKKMAKMV